MKFEFNSAEIVNLLKSENAPISFVGNASSHFQSEPLLFGSTNHPLPPTSDWEFELLNNIEGRKSCIKQRQVLDDLPQFLKKKDQYLKRSKELGDNMYRFSFDFARLCPIPGIFNKKLMEEYIRTLAKIRLQGQEPMVTLHHFTMPLYLTSFDKKGRIVKAGFEHPDVLKHIRFYVQNVFQALSNKEEIRLNLYTSGFDADDVKKLMDEGLVKYFMTFNEPSIILFNGYVMGNFPPYRKFSLRKVPKVMRTLIKAHDIMYETIKKLETKFPKDRSPMIGIGYSWQYFDGFFGSSSHKIINRYITKKFERNGSHTDFIGIHYYFRKTISIFKSNWKGRDYSDQSLFSDVYPAGIVSILKEIHRDYPAKEIFITEIGFADAPDRKKPFWLLETIGYILEAKKLGIPIKGILHWSLANNFEWEFGMTASRFGLFSENDLALPLPQPNAQSNGTVRSFEAWRAITKAILEPSETNLNKLQECYEKAETQYHSTKTNLQLE